MAVVFDSDDYRPPETVAAARTVFQEHSAPSTVEFDTSSGTMAAVMEAWVLGEAHMFRAAMTTNRLRRSSDDVRRGPAGTVGLALQEKGTGRFAQFGVQYIVRPGDLIVVDLDSPYDFGWPGLGCSRCIHVPFEALGLSHDQIGRAAENLSASPLYDVAKRHVQMLCIGRDHEVPRAAADDVGVATVALARAFMATAQDPDGSDHDHTVSVALVCGYIERHLTQPGLSVHEIACAHGYSVPDLVQWMTQLGFDIDQWILAQRLQRVRDELAASAGPPGPEHALRWGFHDFGHLRTAFHDTYGIGIEQWWERDSWR